MDLPGFIDSGQMFSGFFDQWDQDQTHEHVRNASIMDNMFNFLDQEYSGHTDASKRNRYRQEALRQGKLSSRHLLVAVLIALLVEFENFIEYGVMAVQVVEDKPGRAK